MSPEQIEQIVSSRQLLQQLTVVAPGPAEHMSQVEHADYLQLAQLVVSQGDHVAAGGTLAKLSDHCELYIEEHTFEQDAHELNRVASEGQEVTAMIDSGGSSKVAVSGLRILYVENEVERDSRALQVLHGFCPTSWCVTTERRPDITSSAGDSSRANASTCWYPWSDGKTRSSCRSTRWSRTELNGTSTGSRTGTSPARSTWSIAINGLQ